MSDQAPFSPESRIASARAEMEFARARVFPIIWGRLRLPEPQIFHNGSGFFLDCGEGPFGVTAAHVIAQLRDDLAAVPAVGAQLLSLPFDLASRVRALSLDSDLATFGITADEVQMLGVTPCTSPPSGWPPAPPVVGTQVFLAGSPKGARLPFEGDRQGLGLHFASANVATAGPRALGLHMDSRDRMDFLGKGFPGEGFELGGLSGAPVFAVLAARGVIHIEVVGLAAEWVSSYEILRVNLLTCLLPDGSIAPRE